MPRAKLSSKRRATMPRVVRERLGLQTGDEIDFDEERGVYTLRTHVHAAPFQRYRGFLTHIDVCGPEALIEEMHGPCHRLEGTRITGIGERLTAPTCRRTLPRSLRGRLRVWVDQEVIMLLCDRTSTGIAEANDPHNLIILARTGRGVDEFAEPELEHEERPDVRGAV